MTEQLTEYEKTQQFNLVVSSLHSFRYKNIIKIFCTLTDNIPGRPINVLEIGCATGNLFANLDEKFSINYTGMEIRNDYVMVANERHGSKNNFRILLQSATDSELPSVDSPFDIIVALETLEHIPEHDVVRLIEKIAWARPKLFICSVPVEIGPAIWLKNVGSFLMGYMRHREYTWAETFWAGLYQLDKLRQHGTGHKGFDWRWLAQTIRHNFDIKEIRRFPVKHFPSAFSTTVFFVATPRVI